MKNTISRDGYFQFTELNGLSYSKFLSKHFSLSASVCLVNVSCLENTGNKYLAYHFPFQQCSGTLNGNPYAVHYIHVVFFAAGNQSTFFASYILTSYNHRENAVDNSLDLRRNGIPVHRHRVNHRICLQNNRSNCIKIIVERTRFTSLITCLTSTTTTNFQESGIKSPYSMAKFFSTFYKRCGHGETVAIFSGTSRNNYYIHMLTYFIVSEF